MNKIYLASGWWKPGHLEELKRLEDLLIARKHGFFSPRLEPPAVTKDSSAEERHLAFQRNLWAIANCKIVFARIDDYDPGTVWEMGFAKGQNRNVVAWSLISGRKLNLMLVEGCKGFINGWDNVERFFLPEGKLDREVAQTWQKEVE